MSVLEFTEVLASQLLNNCYNDVDMYENDPDQIPFMDPENSILAEDCSTILILSKNTTICTTKTYHIY